MRENKYASRIEKPKIYTTSKGGRYVHPFDILRSESGRAVIDRLANDNLEGSPSDKEIKAPSKEKLVGGADK